MKIQDIKPIINTDDKETKHNLEMANNAKHSNIKLPWSSCLLRHSARTRGGLILHCVHEKL